MKESGWSGSRRMGALLMLLVACGSRSRLELGSWGGEGAVAGAASGTGGVAAGPSGGASGLGGTAVTGGTFNGGRATGGTSTGGTSTGGACAQADFDNFVEPDQAVAYMMDPGHTGAQLATRIEPPLAEIWERRFDAAVSYPIVVHGLVYVAVAGKSFVNRQEVFSTTLYAMDAASGVVAWEATLHHSAVGGPFTVHLAYNRGILVAASLAGTIAALDAASGDILWETTTEIKQLGSVPLASGGAVFVTGDTGREYASFALDACDGHTIWRGQAQGPGGHPTLGAGMLFTSGRCGETSALYEIDGSPLWTLVTGCSGEGGGERTVYSWGVLYAGEFGTPYAIDVNSGDSLEVFETSSNLWPPSVADDNVVFRSSSGGFHALDVYGPSGGFVVWSVALEGYPWLPALLTPGYAWVLAGGQPDAPGLSEKYLYAVDLGARDVVWQAAEPAVPSDPEWTFAGNEPLPGIAASEGRVFVSFQNRLVAYHPFDGPEGFCGDGIVQGDETCDGPTPAGTSCGETCQIVFDGVMLAAGNFHTCGLRADRSVICWGPDLFDAPPGSYQHVSAYEGWTAGVLTDGSPIFWGNYGIDFSAMGNYTKLEAGFASYCGLDQAGLLECAGTIPRPNPDLRYAEFSIWNELCAITLNDELFCYGGDFDVQWKGSYRAVAVGDERACAIRTNRTVQCENNRPRPPGEFTAITAGYGFHCGIQTNGELDCWGSLTARDGSSLQPPPGKFSLIDAGWQHVCAVRTDGVTVCWGTNESGQAAPPMDFP